MKDSSKFFTIGLVTAWYSSNIGVLLLNKYLLSNYGFKYPIFLTLCHMTACSLLSYIAIAWMKMAPMQNIRSRVQFMKISALSIIFCASVVSGNISLKYLPVSFTQAIGATTPFFTAIFAYLMTLKREDWLTYVTLIPVVTGVIIASGGEPSFHLFGFIMCMGATAARALKSVLQGILLSSEGEKLNSMNLLLYMAPIAVVFLLPATLIMEENVVGITIALTRDDIKIMWYLIFNSALAFCVNLTNFLVTKHTSALTLQVLGNAKGAVAVVVSILIFRNPVSITGMLGYSLTCIGVEQWRMALLINGLEVSAMAGTGSRKCKRAVAVVVSILIFRNPVSITGMLGYSSLVLEIVVLYSEAKKEASEVIITRSIRQQFFFCSNFQLQEPWSMALLFNGLEVSAMAGTGFPHVSATRSSNGLVKRKY
ncbi:hypothetical protein Nepgr_017225 [Nepenthes gracilis]|uniref:Sugar phosphate transporter domain-containing protein n=1 Tax=Nepenthes gracilis TaxID=150966 RepID=A0AAD3SR89_NEPGR|nr:hypothetical protein Nepgr_017225 [Nepenthes gracilis]